MPLSELHKKKLKKNLAVMGLILAWCALIWIITMVKIAHAEDASYSDWKDASKRFIGQRTMHQDNMRDFHEQMNQRRMLYNQESQQAISGMKQRAAAYNGESQETVANMSVRASAYNDESNATRDKMAHRAEVHNAETKENPSRWWSDWVNRLIP